MVEDGSTPLVMSLALFILRRFAAEAVDWTVEFVYLARDFGRSPLPELRGRALRETGSKARR
jgi:hypothetical protein